MCISDEPEREREKENETSATYSLGNKQKYGCTFLTLCTPCSTIFLYASCSADFHVAPLRRWGYVCEEVDDQPDYVPNMNCPGEYKQGALKGTCVLFCFDRLDIDLE